MRPYQAFLVGVRNNRDKNVEQDNHHHETEENDQENGEAGRESGSVEFIKASKVSQNGVES